MKFLGLDSAALTGYAYIATSGTAGRASNWWEFGTVRADSHDKGAILATAKTHGVTHACIERPRPFGGSQVGTYGAMSESYGRWLEALALAGIIAVPCYVAAWQAAMLIVNGRKVKANVDGDPKYGSKLIAGYHGAEVRNGDEADAVCLCLYGPTALKKLDDQLEEKRAARRVKARAKRKAA